MQNVKYQTEEIRYSAGTEFGKFSKNVELDSNFDYCDGVQVIELSNGGVPFYNIGLEDKSNTYHSQTHKNDWINGTDTPINSRYKDVMIPVINGSKLQVVTQFDAVPTQELRYQIIFKLKKKSSK